MVTYKKLTIVVAAFAFLGILLSGYLSYWNLIGPSCHQGPLSWLVSCGGPGKVLIFGLPTCIYGFAMFLAVFVLAVLALASKPRPGLMRALIIFGAVGTLFASFLVVYEVLFLKLSFTGLPACVYGLVFYLGILVTSVVSFRSASQAPNALPSK